jgi:hypothetical protein
MIFFNLENPPQPTLFVSAPKISPKCATNSSFFMQAASTRSFTPLSRSWRALKYQVHSLVTTTETLRRLYLMAALHFTDPANYVSSAIWRVCEERKSKGGIGRPQASIGAWRRIVRLMRRPSGIKRLMLECLRVKSSGRNRDEYGETVGTELTLRRGIFRSLCQGKRVGRTNFCGTPTSKCLGREAHCGHCAGSAKIC